MKHFLTGVAAVLALAACTPRDDSHAGQDHAAHTAEGIVVSSAVVKPPFPGRDVSAGYFSLTNHGADDRLVSVSTPISPRAELHNHINDGGVMKMRKVEGVDLAHGESVEFKSGGYHVMMFGVVLPEDAVDVALTLNFEKAEPITVIAEVEGRGDAEGDTHSGH